MKLSTALSALLVCAPVAMAIVVPPAVAYAADGSAVLRKLDADAEAFTDISYVSTMEIYKNGSKRKTLQFDMVMKGLDKQYVNFTSPGDVAGMQVLMVGADLWVYSPEFQKVRKVAAHAQAQGLFGSEFTYEDMALAKMSSKFDANITGKSGNETYVELTPKAGQSISWAKLELTIDKTKGAVTKIKYYDGSGKVVREQIRAGWSKVAGKPFPTKVTMKNLKTGAETVVKISGVKVNTGVQDSLFSKRTLLR